MFHTDYIRLSLNLKDPNVIFAETCVEQKIKGATATLTYTPTHCKCKRENTDFLLVKNGFLTSRVKWLHIANRPAYRVKEKATVFFVVNATECSVGCYDKETVVSLTRYKPVDWPYEAT